MEQILKSAWRHGISYAEYQNLVETYAQVGKTSGHNQSDAFINYTKLNAARMKRWERVFNPQPESIEAFSNLNQPEKWLVITETWCGDAAHNLPVIAKLAALNSHITLRTVFRDENESLMNLFLTNGGKSIPKLIRLAPDFEVLGTWGPRPFILQQKILEHKANPLLTNEAHVLAVQAWYNESKGMHAEQELVNQVAANLK